MEERQVAAYLLSTDQTSFVVKEVTGAPFTANHKQKNNGVSSVNSITNTLYT
jgi:hypothetical protein